MNSSFLVLCNRQMLHHCIALRYIPFLKNSVLQRFFTTTNGFPGIFLKFNGDFNRILSAPLCRSYTQLTKVRTKCNLLSDTNNCLSPSSQSTCLQLSRYLSTSATNGHSGEQVQQPTLFQKFKEAYQKQGKVLVVVHVITSVFWLSSLFGIAVYGIDVIHLLEKIGAPQSVISFVSKSGAGHMATAYVLYKLITPLRYVATLGGTRLAIIQLRKRGFMPPVPEGAKFKDFIKDGKVILKEKRRKISTKRSRRKKS